MLCVSCPNSTVNKGRHYNGIQQTDLISEIKGEHSLVDGIHICIQLSLSGGYKYTFKSLESRRGFYFKDFWVIKDIIWRFNFAVPLVDL